MNKKIKKGTLLYYTDTNIRMGKVEKVLKKTVHVRLTDGDLRKGFPLHHAEKMVVRKFRTTKKNKV